MIFHDEVYHIWADSAEQAGDITNRDQIHSQRHLRGTIKEIPFSVVKSISSLRVDFWNDNGGYFMLSANPLGEDTGFGIKHHPSDEYGWTFHDIADGVIHENYLARMDRNPPRDHLTVIGQRDDMPFGRWGIVIQNSIAHWAFPSEEDMFIYALSK